MKKYEKMAEEWWLKNRELNNAGEGTFSPSDAYIAGFLAAREMAAKRVKDFQIDIRVPEGGGNTIFTLDPRDWCLIGLLGEDEI